MRMGCILVVLTCVISACADTIQRLDGSGIDVKKIDSTVTRLMAAGEVPGVAIAILNGDKVVYEHAYGLRDTAKKLPLTTNTVMSGASLTKAAFAYMVMQLVQEHKLDLDRPVYEYLPRPLPEYPKYSDLKDDPRYKKITARMLLSHTAGFPNWRAFEDDHELHIHFDPGSRYAYSGEGIALLQLVVETITKTNLETLMQQRVFRPVGMTHTSLVWQSAFDAIFSDAYDE